MVWWIGFWATAGSVWFLVLDYRGRKHTGRAWLSRGWAARLAFYALVGAVGGASIAGFPIIILDMIKSVVGLVRHPPTPRMLLSLLPAGVGGLAFVYLGKLAHQLWQIGVAQVRSSAVGRGVGFLTLAAGLFGLATLSVGFSAFISIQIMRSV